MTPTTTGCQTFTKIKRDFFFKRVLSDVVTILGSENRLRAARQCDLLSVEARISQKWAQS